MAIAKITNEQLKAELEEGMTNKAIAEKYGMNIRNVELRRSKLAKSGVGHGRDVSKLIPDGYAVKGVSSMVDDEGNIKLQWVKSSQDKQHEIQMMQAVVDALNSSIEKAEASEMPSIDFDETLALYPVFDLHIGAMAHKHECGANYNTAMAEEVMNGYFDYAVNKAPNSEEAVLLIGGDLLHSDGLDSVTPASGHSLDQDSRFAKLVYVAMRSIRRAINKMLSKHKKVSVCIIEGNHDESSMIWLRAAMAAFYEDDKRVFVETSPRIMHHIQYGATFLAFTHGHTMRKASTRLEAAASDWREDFGKSKHVYTHSGHWHSQTVTEGNLGIDEIHGQLGSPDAYSARGGWRSRRQAAVIIYSKEFGEVGRFICRPDMF
jgi:hypothetical protein